MIWKKMDHNLIPSIEPRDIVFECYLNKFDIKANRLKERYFILTKKSLYYKKVFSF
jgi:hypothetical protein